MMHDNKKIYYGLLLIYFLFIGCKENIATIQNEPKWATCVQLKITEIETSYVNLQKHEAQFNIKFPKPVDPNDIDSHLRRTDAALWIEDSQASSYLKDLERVFSCTPYHAGSCNRRASAILSGIPEFRKKLLPLALLLARMAVEKEPENPDFRRIMSEALYHAKNREDQDVMW